MKEIHNQNKIKSDINLDWVCYNCTNLNYSFRKICNRCKRITRQQNHQNFIQMQYLQIYYQQPFITNIQDNQNLMENIVVNTVTSSNLDSPKVQKNKIGLRKQSNEGSQYSQITDFKNLDWTNSETQGRFMFLLQNAWQGLYNQSQISQFKTSQQTEKTREQEEQEYENEDILTNFDFTFI